MNTKEAAKQLRTELKAAGYNSRKVSVRAHLYSLGSTLRVGIKDASVSLAVVKRIAEKFERVDRSGPQGEIMGGGNRFVSVDYYTAAVRDAVAATTMGGLVNALISIDRPGETSATVTQGITIRRTNIEGVFDIWDNGHNRYRFYGNNVHGQKTGALYVASILDERDNPAPTPAPVAAS